MKNLKQNQIIYALALIVLGILFLVLKDEVIGIAMTILGVALIVVGVLDIIGKFTVQGIIEIAAGVVIIVCGWLITQIVLYILAALFVIYGVYHIYQLIKQKARGFSIWQTIALYLPAVIEIVIGVLLFLNGFGWVFIVVGVVFLVEGIVELATLLIKK
jgi:uncharacterized membrane protein HdeD (DUF308 family)